MMEREVFLLVKLNELLLGRSTLLFLAFNELKPWFREESINIKHVFHKLPISCLVVRIFLILVILDSLVDGLL